MATLGDAYVYLRADKSGLTTTLGQAKTETTNWAQGVSQNAKNAMTGALGGLASIGRIAIGSALGVLTAELTTGLVRRLEASVSSMATLGQATLELQRVTGATAEQASGLLAVFERYGVATENAGAQLGVFAKHIAGIADESDALIAAGKGFAGVFQDLGVKTTTAAGAFRPMYDVILDVADAFQKMPDGVAKSNDALTLFGRSGRDMIPVLNLGRQGILDATETARQYGLVLSQQNVKAIFDFGQAQRDAGEALKGLMVQMGVIALPVLTAFANGAANLAATLNESIIPAFRRLAEQGASQIVGPLKEGQDALTVFGQKAQAGAELAIDGISRLGAVFFSALSDVVSIAWEAARSVYEALSYLNPFASHSPSLVSQVDEGVKRILDRYGELRNFGAPFKAGSDQMEQALARQKDLVDALKSGLDQARSALQRWSQTPLVGEGKASDQLFNLQEQIKRAELNLTNLQIQHAPKRQIDAAQRQIDQLELRARQLQLQTDLKYDPQHRAIDKAASEAPPESTLATILKNIAQAKSDIKTLTPVYDAQRLVLDGLDRAAKAAGESLKGLSGAGVGALGGGLDPKASAAAKAAWDAQVAQFKTDLKGITDWFDNATAGVQRFRDILVTVRTQGWPAGISEVLWPSATVPLTEAQKNANQQAQERGLPPAFNPKPRFVDWAPLLQQVWADFQAEIGKIPWDTVWDNVQLVAAKGEAAFRAVGTKAVGWITEEVGKIDWYTALFGADSKARMQEALRLAGSAAGTPQPSGPGIQVPGLSADDQRKLHEQGKATGFGIGTAILQGLKDSLAGWQSFGATMDQATAQWEKDRAKGMKQPTLFDWVGGMFEGLAVVVRDKGLKPLSDAFTDVCRDGLQAAADWLRKHDDETAGRIINELGLALASGSAMDRFKNVVKVIGRWTLDAIKDGIDISWQGWENWFNKLIASFKPDPLKVPVQFVDSSGNPIAMPEGTGIRTRPLPTPPHAQYGADWLVGGTGGTDSQLVQFRATPGERVIVQTPGQQQAAGGSDSIVIHMPITIQGNADLSTVERFRQVVRSELTNLVSGNRRTQPRLELGHTRI